MNQRQYAQCLLCGEVGVSHRAVVNDGLESDECDDQMHARLADDGSRKHAQLSVMANGRHKYELEPHGPREESSCLGSPNIHGATQHTPCNDLDARGVAKLGTCRASHPCSSS